MKTGLHIILRAKDVEVHANHPPWITTEFKKLIESKQQAFHSKNVILYRTYHNRNNKERKRLSSIFLEMKVNHLKETTPPLWCK